jgi:NAD(P)-dependent dehydrogenase (short-subunit alcohol dehydrogenase family)
LETHGSGHVVQITTSLVDHANSGVPCVLASLTKGDLNPATKSLAIEYAKRGICVNAISPGIIKSPMLPGNRVVIDILHGGGPDDDPALHPIGGIGADGNVLQAVSESPHGLHAFIGRSFRGPIGAI